MQPKTREANWFQHDTRALQAYLGHRNIQNTVRYTELSPDRFKDFWRSSLNDATASAAQYRCISVDRWKTSRFSIQVPKPHGHYSRPGT
jgi:hypothetical protein